MTRFSLAILVSFVAGCDGPTSLPDGGPAYDWTPDCMELGPAGDTFWAPVCRDGDIVQAFCETDGGLLVCPRPAAGEDVVIAVPRCRATATVVCNEGNPEGPRLDYPVCLDDSEPSCDL